MGAILRVAGIRTISLCDQLARSSDRKGTAGSLTTELQGIVASYVI